MYALFGKHSYMQPTPYRGSYAQDAHAPTQLYLLRLVLSLGDIHW
jgi:hypothetical protein